ncbi:DM13 domain-containing protein [Leptolyngbya sp. FACHB-671]|uniref:DM13 domain-containing protein n=1 Tax=Leptolyngbya sp. FACHB-671 TaxID=2692812 RepID=UPI001688FE40|nr:DM13 domain-containing protein [Leptolyngbya sp. FACHB-671]MBD1868041.1 DM13 domain-containing protein [Cyanobacteria bacterium FACHB-471]MBD2070031.1 DM13 domain-containing protein [Leptolyngbya sp. FACHB-671]
MKIKSIKHHSIVKFGMVSVLASALSIAAAAATIANPVHGTFGSVIATESLIAQSESIVALAGTFVAAEAPTTGTAQIIEEDGQRYVVLDSAFSTTDMAPDLHVVLETSEVPPGSYSSFGSFVNLGALQSVTGEQRYPIPDSVNLSEFKSVSIWCRTANATMGYAVLGGSSSASIQ